MRKSTETLNHQRLVLHIQFPKKKTDVDFVLIIQRYCDSFISRQIKWSFLFGEEQGNEGGHTERGHFEIVH